MSEYRLSSRWRGIWFAVGAFALISLVALTLIAVKRAGAHNYNGVEAFTTAALLAVVTATLSVAATLLNWKNDQSEVQRIRQYSLSSLGEIQEATALLQDLRVALDLLQQDATSSPDRRSIHVYYISGKATAILNSLTTIRQGVQSLVSEEEISAHENARRAILSQFSDGLLNREESEAEKDARRVSGLEPQAETLTRLLTDLGQLSPEPVVLGQMRTP